MLGLRNLEAMQFVLNYQHEAIKNKLSIGKRLTGDMGMKTRAPQSEGSELSWTKLVGYSIKIFND